MIYAELPSMIQSIKYLLYNAAYLLTDIYFEIFAGNTKDYTNRKHRELSSPCEDSIYPAGSRVPLSRSCSSPAATYGK